MKNIPVYKAKFSIITGCVFFMAMFASSITHAQTRGTVEVIKDARIDTLAARRSALKGSKTIIAYSPMGANYRVQIFSGGSRKDAYDTQARFMNEHPGIRTYINYTQPNYKIKVGDYRTRLEAEKMMLDLKHSYSSVFIIEEK